MSNGALIGGFQEGAQQAPFRGRESVSIVEQVAAIVGEYGERLGFATFLTAYVEAYVKANFAADRALRQPQRLRVSPSSSQPIELGVSAVCQKRCRTGELWRAEQPIFLRQPFRSSTQPKLKQCRCEGQCSVRASSCLCSQCTTQAHGWKERTEAVKEEIWERTS